MAVPKRRTSKHRKRKRRSHLALSKPSLSACPRCGATVKPHTVCDSCGHYRGTEVFPEGDATNV
ncbi:MAG: 50S ribosomal protein L32 [Planctomycetes bacterium]|nr:50S ribosomal protein L32 [Planctomycetota bacterium]MBL8767353.1 50S ribosomal protein L32 [Planctomycetota bacterium]MCC7169839.1 50S ribosomal protein L32 [Planctomycetota bacterium]